MAFLGRMKVKEYIIRKMKNDLIGMGKNQGKQRRVPTSFKEKRFGARVSKKNHSNPSNNIGVFRIQLKDEGGNF